MNVILDIADIQTWVNTNRDLYLGHSQHGRPFRLSTMYEECIKLLNYHFLTSHCSKALVEFRKVWPDLKDQDKNALVEWVHSYTELGSKKLLMFLVDFNEMADSIYMPTTEVHVAKIDFKQIILFLNIFQILFWELQITTPDEERMFYQSRDYYHNSPDSVAALDRLRKLYYTIGSGK